MLDFALPDWNYERPFKGVVRAANGSGKDKFIIAACFVWFLMKYPQSQAVVTSSSSKQLDRQTDRHIRLLCQSVNTLIGEEVWKINFRHYEFLPTKSNGELFATDDPGNAEGWHPTTVTGKQAIFTSESKSIPDEIFIALLRCSQTTHRVDASSPGPQVGYFYNLCQPGLSVMRSDINSPLDTDKVIQYKVTAYDCSHLPKAYIDDFIRNAPGGEH